MNRSPSSRASRWTPAAAAAAALGLFVAYTLRELLAPGLDRLPGTDAGNLYSWELFTRSVLATGRLPHWNPYQFGGLPFLADTQTTVLYPPALLLRWLPPLNFLPWMAALHIWLGGLGTLFLGRVAGLGWLAATAAAIAAMLGGSVAPWLFNGHLLLIYCAAWLPWALAFAVRSARRPTVWPHPLLVLVLVVQCLAGYLQGSVYLTAAVCLYFVYAVAWPDPLLGGSARWRPLAQLALLGTLALGLSAFQLLPTARLASEAARTSGISFDAAARGGWTPGELATFFFPFQGIESESPHRWMSDRASYIGWLLACLIPFSFLDRDRRRLAVFFAVLAIVAVAFAFGAALPFYRLHYAVFPGFRIPGRLLFVATPGLAVLGAIGLQRLIAMAARLERQRGAAAAAAAIASGAIVVAVVASLLLRTPSPVRTWWLPFAAIGGLAAVILLAARVGPRAAGIAAIAVVAVDLAAYSSGAVQTVPVTSADTVRRWIGRPDGGRALSLCENAVGPHELLLNRRPTFDGVGGVSLRSYADWAGLALDEGPLPMRRDLLDASNITSIVSCRPIDAPSLTLVSNVDPILVYRNQAAWPRAVWTCAAETLSHPEVIDQLRVGRYDENQHLIRGYLVNVRWAAGLPEGQRQALEARYHLQEPEHREGDTWRYRVHDLPADDARALLRDPAVLDTHGLDRGTGDLVERVVEVPEDAGPDMLIGTAACDERPDVQVVAADGPDGRVEVNVAARADGVLFFSEPYYPERQAFVDGVAAPAARANVAFTAVPVPAGPHRVELRYVPASFRAGAALSGATLAVWMGGLFFFRVRGRGPAAARRAEPGAALRH